MRTNRVVARTISDHSLLAVGALALLVGGSAFFVRRAYCDMQPPPMNAPLTVTLALLAIVPLTWRPRFLIAAFVFVLAAVVALNVYNTSLTAHFSSIPSVMATFSSAANGGRRRNLACVASIVAFNGGLVYSLMNNCYPPSAGSTVAMNAIGLIWNLMAFIAAWYCGNAVRSIREEASSLWERTGHLSTWHQRKALLAVIRGRAINVRMLGETLARFVAVHGAGAVAENRTHCRRTEGEAGPLTGLWRPGQEGRASGERAFTEQWVESALDVPVPAPGPEMKVRPAGHDISPALNLTVPCLARDARREPSLLSLDAGPGSGL